MRVSFCAVLGSSLLLHSVWAESFPLNQLGVKVEEQHSQNLPQRSSEGYSLEASLQDLRAIVVPQGLKVQSMSETEGRGEFTLRPVSLDKGILHHIPAGVVQS